MKNSEHIMSPQGRISADGGLVRMAPQAHPLGRTVAVPVIGSSSSDAGEFLRGCYKLLVVTGLLGLAAAYVYTKSQTPQFRAAATIEIQDLNDNFLNRQVSQVSPFASAPVVNDMQTQLRILQSGALIARTLQSLPKEIVPPPRGAAVWLARMLPAAGVETSETAMDRAAQRLQVRETRQSRIVDVTFESPEAGYAAAFSNALAQHFIEQSIEARIQISHGTSVFLEKQLADVGAKMAESEQRLQDYARKSGLLVTSEEHRPDEERFRQIQESLSKAQENRMVKQARMETAASAPLDSLDTPLASALRDFQTRLADLRRQRADLATVYTTEFDGIKRLDAQITRLEADQLRESTTILQSIKNDYADAVRRERLLEQSYQDQFLKVTEQAGIAIQYGILKRAVDTNRDLYNNLLQRTAEAKVASALRASGARIVDAARVPRHPYKPNTILNLLWGGTAGMLIGLVMAVARRGSRARVAAVKDLAFGFGLPELGSVPKFVMRTPVSARRGAEAGFLRIPGREASEEGEALAIRNHEASAESNSFRSILASILLSGQGGSTPQVIVVTSAHQGEGKTTVVSNLATMLARMGRRVLLVDACPERKLQRLFQAVGSCSLEDVLELSGDNASLLPYVTSDTCCPGVSLVCTGEGKNQTLDLIFATGLVSILTEIRRNYDIALIDTPSLEELPGARVLGKLSDGVVLVTQEGEGSFQSMLAAAKRLREDGAFVLGSVLNKVS